MKKILMGMMIMVMAGFGITSVAKHHGGKMFAKADTNGDGIVSKEEFLKHSETKFMKIDADGDGSITKEEIKAHRKAKREKRRERRKELREKRKEMKSHDHSGDGTPPTTTTTE